MVKGSDSIKFLGIILDKELDMRKFIVAKARTAYLNILKIKRIRKYLTEDDTNILICSMVLSHLDYGNLILVNLPKSTLKPLQSIKNYAAKVTCKKQKYGNSTDCLSKLHWLPIHYRCIYKLLIIVYKTLHEKEPQYLSDKLNIKTVDKTTRYDIANNKQLLVPVNRKKTQGDRGFSFTGPSYWNKLPNYVKEAENLRKLNKLLKAHF